MEETPFGKKTRQNRRNSDPFTFSLGQRESKAIPRTGYLARVDWHFSGTLTVTLGGGTAVLDGTGPWSFLNRSRIAANSGTDIYSTSGYGAYLVNQAMISNQGFLTQDSGWPAAIVPGYSTQIYNAPTSAGANAWECGLRIPVALNEESELGLILLQNELASMSIAFEYANAMYSLVASQAPVLVTGAAVATLTGQISPLLEYFAVPVDPQARPDITWIHQILEVQNAIGSTGDVVTNLVRENMYLGLLHNVILNNALNTVDIDRWRLTLNTSDTPYDMLKKSILQIARFEQHVDLPVGCYFMDFFNQGEPGFGDERDLINGKATSELQSILTVNSAATLGAAGASRLQTITRQLVKLTGPAVNGA